MKRSWFSRHPLCFMALYLILYLSAFNFLNTQIHMPHILVHCRLDDLIPFCKYAVIPYFAWFPWIPFTLFFLLWKAPREDFWRLCMPLFSGMTIALACYVILPTGLNLRPCYVPDLKLPEEHRPIGMWFCRRLWETPASRSTPRLCPLLTA